MNSSKKVISVIIGSAIFCSIQANNVNHDVSSKDARSIFQQQVEENVENQNFVAFHDDSFAVLKKVPSSKIALEIFQRNNHYPHKTLVLGGNAEASVQHSHNTNLPIKEKKNNELVEPTNSSDKTSTNFALKEVGINTMVNLNQYMTSYIAASAVGNNMSPKIDDIFMLVGNTEIAPVYFTVGKSRIPFGVFAGGIWTDSITKMLFQPNRDINASLGVYTYGIGADITLFKKDNHFSNIAITASYDGDIADVNYKIQGGYISDVKGSGNAFNNPLYENAKISRIGAVNFDASVN